MEKSTNRIFRIINISCYFNASLVK